MCEHTTEGGRGHGEGRRAGELDDPERRGGLPDGRGARGSEDARGQHHPTRSAETGIRETGI